VSDLPRADIVSLDVQTPDCAVLTYTVHGAPCRIALGINQVEIIRLMSSRVQIAMEAGRQKRGAA
jgi:hypothetical protein